MENPSEPHIAHTFAGRARAEEYALVILAMGLPYWILEEEGQYHLCIRAEDAEKILPELAQYDKERRAQQLEWRQKQQAIPFSYLSLFFFVVAMLLAYLLQLREGTGWIIKGRADALAILNGDWHRTLTALTLHADFGHLLANLGAGAIFAAGLLPLVGVGWTWFGMIMGGALGNLINAWGHRAEGHLSIGASTAVFAGLGMLVAWQAMAALRHAPRAFRMREIFIPLAAGLALLAFLGTGEKESRVDIMAHLLGMVAGGGIAVLLFAFDIPRRTPRSCQVALALLSIALLIFGWLKA